MTTSNPLISKFRQTVLLSVGLVLCAGLLLSAVYMYMSNSRQATYEVNLMGEDLTQQSELLIRPLLLANDRVSLNYLLNELNAIHYLSGIQIQDSNGIVIARAGELTQQKKVKPLRHNEKAIGTLTLWLDSSSTQQRIINQLWPPLIIALSTVIFAMIALWISCRQLPQLVAGRAAEPQPPSFSETLSETLTVETTAPTETPSEPLHQAGSYREADQQNAEQPETELPPVVTPVVAPVIEPVVESATQPATEPSDRFENQNSHSSVDSVTEPAVSEPLQTQALVDLLKPEQGSGPQMPKFEHHPEDLEPQQPEPKTEAVVVEEEITPEANLPETPNPLQQLDDREEEQLDLYSFEHELELFLPAQESIYLFYIDSNTASSDNMDPNEKATLLNVYHYLAKQVARIYNGEAELLENHDVVIRFELRDEQDGHGINALCAAMLFNLLYKGFNQSRIMGFQPVISLQMSLARGHHAKYDLVKEEAHFLTRTTGSNELISHTALTEAQQLKESMLADAEIRREDEDKVLLMKLTPKHQALLQKQANHLLTKIFRKDSSDSTTELA